MYLIFKGQKVGNLKIILILQNEMLLLMLICKRVLKQREDIPRFGKTINSSFLETVCYTVFCVCCLFKSILMNLSIHLLNKLFLHET